MNKNIHVHIFSYSGDKEILLECVRCVRQALPESHIIVIDEEGKECPEEIRRAVIIQGAEWRVSCFPRRGNLRGKECISGMLGEMLASARSENDVLIKLDSDSCLMNGDDFRKLAMDEGKVMYACGKFKDRIHGFCYAIKAYAVKTVLEALDVLDMPEYVPEDIIIGLSMFNLYPDESLYCLYSPVDPDATWRAFFWWRYPDPRKYGKSTVVTTGNPPPFPFTEKQRPIMMRYLREEAARVRGERRSSVSIKGDASGA